MANHTYCIELIEGDHDYLLSLSKNRTIQAQIVERAKILLQKEAGKPDKSVAEGLCIDVSTVRLCVQKYLEGGTDLALYDRQRKGRPAEISTDAVAWIINTACQRPADLGLLAGIDLLTGEAIPLVSDTHKSSDFVRFLKILDLKYPPQDTIRIILDNHSAHTSKETKAFLATMPEGRFEFVFTPKHGSWLNMIESFFSKMTKQMLKGIRVKSKQELIDRIYKYFKEINADPVVFHWKYKMDEIQL